MIFEYTKEEKQQLIEIDSRYAALLDQKDAELQKHGKTTKIYARLLEERDELEISRFAEFTTIYEQAERDRFNALNGDIAAIVSEARSQVNLIIEKYIESDFVRDDNGESAMQKWQDGNITDTAAQQLLQEADFITRSQKAGKPVISSQKARRLIYSGIILFIDFLREHAPAEEKALKSYISEYISKSPFIYVQTYEPELEAEIVTEDIREPLQRIETYGLMNDKVNRTLITGNFMQQDADGKRSLLTKVKQSGITNETPVIVTMSFTFTNDNIKLSRPIAAFDNAVQNAIATAFYYHKRNNNGKPFYITPQEIWRLMNGTQDANKNPSEGQVKKVCDSMDKMRFTRLNMDISEEINRFNLTFKDSRITHGKVDTYLLKADKVSFTTEKGREIIGYRVDDEPILYTYNAAKNHILFVPFEILDTSQTTGNEGSTIEIRNYLIQQIQLMYNGQRNSHRILYETLYNATGLETPDSRINHNHYSNENSRRSALTQEAKKDREKVAAILEAWKEKAYIKDFEPIKKGRAFIGIDITLQSHQPQKEI